MRIIKKGYIPDPVIYEGKCDYCDSELEATENELDDNPLGFGFDNTSGQCFVCGREMSFVRQISQDDNTDQTQDV